MFRLTQRSTVTAVVIHRTAKAEANAAMATSTFRTDPEDSTPRLAPIQSRDDAP